MSRPDVHVVSRTMQRTPCVKVHHMSHGNTRNISACRRGEHVEAYAAACLRLLSAPKSGEVTLASPPRAAMTCAPLRQPLARSSSCRVATERAPSQAAPHQAAPRSAQLRPEASDALQSEAFDADAAGPPPFPLVCHHPPKGDPNPKRGTRMIVT